MEWWRAAIEWVMRHPFLAIVIALVTLTVAESLADELSARLFHRPLGKRIGKAIFVAISVTLLVAAYFTVVALTALAFRLLRKRLLPDFRNKNVRSYWREREKTEPTLDYVRRQF
ncbi:hypothetical protein FJY63_03965 [Candidatus Sumerlaeota bacterium]|nr:hypothetical protein [Candidatus Sumerlaeota bacterium]